VSEAHRCAAADVASRIANTDCEFSCEADLQAALHVTLASYYPVVREWRLSVRDRVDFLVSTGTARVAVEIKIQGARNPVLRQLGRYAAHDQVDALVLASTRRVLLHAMPPVVHGKPVAVALVGGVGRLV
jgi:hypothetical protein